MTIQPSDGTDLRILLEDGARKLGIDIDDREVNLFLTYLQELTEWNQKINLTAIRDEKGIVVRHFLDSLALYRFLGNTRSLLDIGAGAGFPGIPLKIVRPLLDLVLLESVGKKIVFLRHIIRALGLNDVKTLHGRAEDHSIVEQYRGAFDIVVSRAFARLNDFLSVAVPYTKESGLIIAVKGPRGDDELKEATAAAIHHLSLERVEEITVPFSGMASHCFLFRKGGAGHE